LATVFSILYIVLNIFLKVLSCFDFFVAFHLQLDLS